MVLAGRELLLVGGGLCRDIVQADRVDGDAAGARERVLVWPARHLKGLAT